MARSLAAWRAVRAGAVVAILAAGACQSDTPTKIATTDGEPDTTTTTAPPPPTTTSTTALVTTTTTSTTRPPATTTTRRPTTTTTAEAVEASGCHPSYTRTCIPADVSDADCAGGSGNGPYYVREKNIGVVGPDEYDLDRDNDGVGCES